MIKKLFIKITNIVTKKCRPRRTQNKRVVFFPWSVKSIIIIVNTVFLVKTDLERVTLLFVCFRINRK